jgi:hypothetical protein
VPEFYTASITKALLATDRAILVNDDKGLRLTNKMQAACAQHWRVANLLHLSASHQPLLIASSITLPTSNIITRRSS